MKIIKNIIFYKNLIKNNQYIIIFHNINIILKLPMYLFIYFVQFYYYYFI